MSTNHVHPEQNGPMFGDGHDGFNFNNMYSGQPYPNNLLVEQQHAQHSGTPTHSPYNPTSAFSPPPTWQNTATSSAQPAPAQGNPYGSVNRNYYGVPASNAQVQVPFQNVQVSNQAGRGMGQVPYNQPYDPSLSRPGDDRSFTQSMGAFSSAPQSTIAPSALHQSPTLHRQVASPGAGSAMQGVFSSLPMPNQSRDFGRALPMNGSNSSQTLKAPKGTRSGNFIVVTYEDLAKTTQSQRMHNFVNLGKIPVDLPYNKAATVPHYVARKSPNELKALAASDPTLHAKIMKRAKKAKFHVPKYGRESQFNNQGSPMSLSSATDSSDAESDSSYESDSPEPEASPLPASRPQKAMEIVRYDTIKAVWLPRNKFAENSKILQGMGALWEVTRTIRDRWNQDRDAVKKAVETKKDGELPLLKERVEKQREMMEAVLKASVQYGHPDLLSACGQNGAMMALCYQFLLEPIRENDYAGSFMNATFKFLSMCTNLSSELAEKSNLSKLISRAIKRGTEDIKMLATKVNENIAAESKKSKTPATKSVEPKLGRPAEPPTTTLKASTMATGIKRPPPADNAIGQPAKRVASGAAPGPKETAAARLGLAKKPASTVTTNGPVKAKVNPKPTTSFFSGLQSASKKPGTGTLAAALTKPKVVGAIATDKKGPAPSAPMSAARPAFSFAETMANLHKDKAQVPVKKEEEKRAPETAEEKAKRLRKEERRKLRVTWRPDAALVEIRLFSRDPSEITGNTSSNVRDVGDGKEKEGHMFKRHMETMDVDADEEDDQPMEQSYFDYKEPSNIDFSNVPQTERERNYERFGGVEKVDSQEFRVQENRAMTELVVHYLVQSDIPPNPREPADPFTGPHVESKDFGYPDDTNRWLNARLQKLSAPVAPVASTTPDAPDISALLQLISATRQPQQENVPAPPDFSALQNIVAQNGGLQPQQQTAQPLDFNWFQPTQPVAPTDSNQGHSAIDDILANLNGGPVPAQQIAQAAPAASTAPLASDPAVAALLAQLMGQTIAAGTSGAAVATTAGAYQNYGVPGASSSDQGQNNYYGSSAAPNPYSSSGTDLDDRQSDFQSRDAKNQRKWQGNPGKKFLHPCKFWKDGKCKKGDSCTFRHD